jgi:chemotaxis protein MotB
MAAALVLLGTSGCASRRAYDDVVAQRDALSSENSTLQTRNTALIARIEAANAKTRAAGEELLEQAALLEQLTMTYDQIVDELEDEVLAGQIAVEQIQSGVNVRIAEAVLFESGSAVLGLLGVDVVTRLGAELQAIPYQIVVGGFTDDVPIGENLARKYPTNWDLAGARAAGVVAALERSGVPSSQLLAISFADTRLVASNETPEGRAQNRRIEVRIRPVEIVDGLPAVSEGSPLY